MPVLSRDDRQGVGQFETRRIDVMKAWQCGRYARMSETISVLKCAQQFAGTVA
jgi:hypothetical protein